MRFARRLAIAQIFFLGLSPANAQAPREPTRPLITQPIDDSRRVTLTGNTRPEANATNDRGPVPESLPMQHLQLLLRLPMEKEEELDRSIDLSGTAGQVHDAFKTEIHYLDVAGVRHIANMSDPQIPAALAPAVAGIASLNDFKPDPMDSAH